MVSFGDLTCSSWWTQGKVIKPYFSGKKDVIFLKCLTGRKGGFIYAVGEDRHLYCFNANTGNLDYTLMVR
jgi:outer membrane protein assembly factor BamB